MSFPRVHTLVACLLLSGGPAWSQAGAAPETCPLTERHLVIGRPLAKSRMAVATGKFTILAIGSSSIEGVGASRPELAFVPLLQEGLKRRLPGVSVNVLNRGVGGETTGETAARMAAEIGAHNPDLVIWQLGTNDVLRSRSIDDFFVDFRTGEAVLERAGVDVMLVDPQRLPETTQNAAFKGRNPALGEISRLIGLEGGRLGYAAMSRFNAMAEWSALDRGGVGPDDLHLNDAGYACWAEITAEGLTNGLR